MINRFVSKNLIRKGAVPAVAALALAMAGCAGNGGADAPQEFAFTWDSIPAADAGAPQVIQVDLDSIGRPSAMVLLNDSVMAVLDSRSPEQIKLLNMRSGATTQLVRKGNGPDEMVSVNSMGVVNDTLWLGGNFDNKLAAIHYDKATDAYRVVDQRTLDFPFMGAVAMGAGSVLTAPATPDSLRFVRVDLNTSARDSTYVFPVEDEHDNNALFQGELAMSPDGKNVVSSSRSWGIVEVFDAADLNRTSLTRGPQIVDSKIELRETPFGNTFVQKPMYIVLVGLATADDAFYTGYIGSDFSKPETMNNGISKVIKYDYTGRPLQYYNLPNELVSFTISRDSATLYGFEEDEEGNLRLVQMPL